MVAHQKLHGNNSNRIEIMILVESTLWYLSVQVHVCVFQLAREIFISVITNINNAHGLNKIIGLEAYYFVVMIY